LQYLPAAAKSAARWRPLSSSVCDLFLPVSLVYGRSLSSPLSLANNCVALRAGGLDLGTSEEEGRHLNGCGNPAEKLTEELETKKIAGNHTFLCHRLFSPDWRFELGKPKLFLSDSLAR
jgi:hypothetical protein